MTIPAPGEGAAVHASPVLLHAPRPPTQRTPEASTATVVGKATGDGSGSTVHVPAADRRQSSSPVAAQVSPFRTATEETGLPARPSSAQPSVREVPRKTPLAVPAQKTPAEADEAPDVAAQWIPDVGHEPQARLRSGGNERRQEQNREPAIRLPIPVPSRRIECSSYPVDRSGVALDPHHVEPHLAPRVRWVLGEPGTRRREEPPPLEGSDGLGRRPTRGVPPPLHLDEDDRPAVPGHQVDLSPAGADVAREERVSPCPSRNRAASSSPPRPFGVVGARGGPAGRGTARRLRDRPSAASRSFHPGDIGRG